MESVFFFLQVPYLLVEIKLVQLVLRAFLL